MEIWHLKLTNHVCVWMLEKWCFIVWLQLWAVESQDVHMCSFENYNFVRVQMLSLSLHWFLLMEEIESIWFRSVEMVAVLRPSRVERQYYLSRLKISFRDHINPNCFLFLIFRSCVWKRSSNFWCVSATVVPVFRRLHYVLALWKFDNVD